MHNVPVKGGEKGQTIAAFWVRRTRSWQRPDCTDPDGQTLYVESDLPTEVPATLQWRGRVQRQDSVVEVDTPIVGEQVVLLYAEVVDGRVLLSHRKELNAPFVAEKVPKGRGSEAAPAEVPSGVAA